MESYATLDETYQLALTARAFVVAPSPILMADNDTGTIRLEAHGYGAADRILFKFTSGGSLTPELSPFVYYSPIVLGGDLFQVADPLTGQPILFSADSRGWAVGVDPVRRLTMHLEDAFSRINQRLGAHATPIKVDPLTGKYPPVLRGLNARMGARSAVTSLQIENPAFRVPLERLFAMAATDGDTNPPGQPGSLLGDYAEGLSVLPAPLDQDTVPNMGPRATNARTAGCARSKWERGTL
jgi:hypothetical protein